MSGSRTVSAEEALAHTDWVHRLARALVDDVTSAEDLAQDAWVAVATRPVPEGTDLRAWWTGVLRKLSLMRARARTGSRRAQREAASPGPEAGLRADELLERLQTQQVVARLVAELPAPVRLVLYLRYYEGLTATQIGEQLGVPAGTVRWRLKCGVDELRERLDRSFDGDRPRWTALVVPFLPRAGSPEHWILKGLVMKANELVWTLVSVVAVALLLGWWLWPKPFEQQASRGGSAEGTRRAQRRARRHRGQQRFPRARDYQPGSPSRKRRRDGLLAACCWMDGRCRERTCGSSPSLCWPGKGASSSSPARMDGSTSARSSRSCTP
jgi:RNA polymerase sigma-70 factor (ECF subfamily)